MPVLTDGPPASSGERAPSRVPGLLTPKTISFLTVGGAGYVVDVVAFNWLRATALFGAMDPLVARVLAMLAAMAVTYVGNRTFTWRSRPRHDRRRELGLFTLFNLSALVLSVIPLFVSHDVLGMTGRLADNISANVVGVALGTLFRYWTYERVVFSTTQHPGRPYPVDRTTT